MEPLYIGTTLLYRIDNNYRNEILEYLKQYCPDFTLNDIDISNNHDMKIIKKHSYHATIDYFGKKYILMFKKIKNIHHSLLIELNGNYNDATTNIYFIPLRVSRDLYRGTILMGTMAKNQKNNDYVFMIFNGIMIENYKLDKASLRERYGKIKGILSKIRYDTFINHFKLEVTSIIHNQQFQAAIAKASNQYMINGILFVSSNNFTTYLFNINTNVSKELIANFEVKKTNTTDVYELYLPKNGIKTRFSIACIQTIAKSHEMTLLLQNCQSKNMSCKYLKKFNKWEPMCPTNNIDDYDKVMHLLEMY